MALRQESADPRKSRLFVTALAHGIQILSSFQEGAPFMKLAALANACGLTKSATQRYVHTMITLGYLRKDPITKEFSLGPKSLEIGLSYLKASPLVVGSNPFLHALNRTCHETCSLAEPDDLDMVYISRFPAHKEMFINMPLGTRIPMHCSASGRAILSQLDIGLAMEILAHSKRESFATKTITQLDRLEALLQEARKNGYAWSDSEYYNGDINVSAAVTDADGIPVAAVNVSVPTSRYTLESAREALCAHVIETAHAISGSNFIRRTETAVAFWNPQRLVHGEGG